MESHQPTECSHQYTAEMTACYSKLLSIGLCPFSATRTNKLCAAKAMTFAVRAASSRNLDTYILHFFDLFGVN